MTSHVLSRLTTKTRYIILHHTQCKHHLHRDLGYKYLCACYSKHECVRIPIAAVHITTSTVQVQVALVYVTSEQAQYLGNLYG